MYCPFCLVKLRWHCIRTRLEFLNHRGWSLVGFVDDKRDAMTKKALFISKEFLVFIYLFILNNTVKSNILSNKNNNQTGRIITGSDIFGTRHTLYYIMINCNYL